jgi:hypothetical protein
MRFSKQNFKKQILLITILSTQSIQPLFAEIDKTKSKIIPKPISQEEWKNLIKDKDNFVYTIQKGDTLWSVSEKLFGSGKYWPKIWAINNEAGMGNPHVLKAGTKIIFSYSNEDALPEMHAVLPNENKSENTKAQNLIASNDDSTLPPYPDTPYYKRNRQNPDYENVSGDLWKPIEVKQKETIKKNFDEYGFEKNIKILPEIKEKIRVPVIMNDSAIPWLGEVESSRQEGAGLSQNAVIFITSDTNDLQVGNTYSILSEPVYLDIKKSDRTGYVYKTLGEVKIIGVKDEKYIGVIQKAYDVIRRGDKIYPLLPIITDIKPINAEQPIEAMVILNPLTNTWNSGQHHYVHFDRGLDDGVQVGNVFRIYEYKDPITKKTITENDMLIQADALVVHVTAQYSTALVIRARNLIKTGDLGVLLLDTSNLLQTSSHKQKIRLLGQPEDSKTLEDSELDNLDKLDDGKDEIGRKEKEELEQLKNWDQNKNQVEEPKVELLDDKKPAIPDEKLDKKLDELPEQSPNTLNQNHEKTNEEKLNQDATKQVSEPSNEQNSGQKLNQNTHESESSAHDNAPNTQSTENSQPPQEPQSTLTPENPEPSSNTNTEQQNLSPLEESGDPKEPWVDPMEINPEKN